MVNAVISCQRDAKSAGGWLLFRLPSLNVVSKKVVGRTGFEPVTSSVSGKSRAVSGVCHRRTESNAEPLTWANILDGSCWVRWRLCPDAI